MKRKSISMIAIVALSLRLGAHFRRLRGGDDPLVRIHVCDGRYAHARGWTMSMAWMRMPGQTWLGAAASFLSRWLVMMVAMMLPTLVPMLCRYRQAVGGAGETRFGRLSALMVIGYFFLWSLFGLAAFALGAAVTGVAMQRPALARAVPLAVGVVVLMAGCLQLTPWKARHLACCRQSPWVRSRVAG